MRAAQPARRAERNEPGCHGHSSLCRRLTCNAFAQPTTVGVAMRHMYSAEWFETFAATVPASIIETELDGIGGVLPNDRYGGIPSPGQTRTRRVTNRSAPAYHEHLRLQRRPVSDLSPAARPRAAVSRRRESSISCRDSFFERRSSPPCASSTSVAAQATSRSWRRNWWAALEPAGC